MRAAVIDGEEFVTQVGRSSIDAMTLDRDALRHAVLAWFAEHARTLPWREPDVGAYGVLVSEVMLQQTPVARVLGPWREWLERWPDPSALAAADSADVLRAWGRLGYPRRALRLQAAAIAIRDRHNGVVPDDLDALRALPGVGEYTAAAVASFAYGRRAVVLDTNVRRVLDRVELGVGLPAPSITVAERRRAEAWLPDDEREAAAWAAASMELGALVCTATAPGCEDCPVALACAWLAAGRPEPPRHHRRTQAWEGTDRQCRGLIVQALREASPRSLADLEDYAVGHGWAERPRVARLVDDLVADGLIHPEGLGFALGN